MQSPYRPAAYPQPGNLPPTPIPRGHGSAADSATYGGIGGSHQDAIVAAALAATASQNSSRTPSVAAHKENILAYHASRARLPVQDVAVLDDSNRQLAGTVTSLTDENVALRTRNSDATMRLQDADRERAALVYRLQDQGERFREREATYLAEIDGLRGERAELLRSLDKVQAQSQVRGNDASLRETEGNNALIEVERLKSTVRAMEGQVQHAEQLAQQRAKELAAASVAKVKLERQLGRAQSEAAGVTAAAAKDVKVAHDKAQEATVKQLQAQDALRITREELSHAQARLQSREHQLAVLTESNTTLKKEASEREALLQTLHLTVADQEHKLAQLEQLRDERLKSVLDETNQQVISIREMMQQRSATYSEALMDKQSQIDGLIAEVANLRRRTADVEREREVAEGDKRKATDVAFAAEHQLKLANETIEHRQAEIGRLRDRLDERDAELRSVIVKHDAHVRNVTERDERIAALEAQLNAFRDKVSNAEASLEVVGAQSARHDRIVAQKDEEITNLNSKISALDTKWRAAQAAAEAAEARAAQNERELSRTLASAAEARFEADRERNLLETRIRTLEEDIRCTKLAHDAEVQKMRATESTNTTSIEESHRAHIRALETQLAATQAEAEALRRHMGLEGTRAAEEAAQALAEAHRRKMAEQEAAHHSVVLELKANHERDVSALRRKLEEAHLRNESLVESVQAAHVRVDELMIAMRRVEEDRVTDVVNERESYRSRDVSIALQLREAEEKANRAVLEAAERVRENEARHLALVSELEARHHDEIKQWRRADHDRQMTFLSSADDRERKVAELTREATSLRSDLEAAIARSLHSILFYEAHIRATNLLLELREREGIVAQRNLYVTRSMAHSAAALSEVAFEAIFDGEARERESIQALATIGAEALRIMTAYHALRTEHEVLRERNGAVLDANDELKSANLELSSQNRLVELLKQDVSALKQQLAEAQRKTVVQQDPELLHEATQLALMIRDTDAVMVSTFQGAPWQSALMHGAISDDLGTDLCNVVESARFAVEKANELLARFDGRGDDASRRGRAAAVPPMDLSGGHMSPSRQAAMSVLGMSPRTAEASSRKVATPPPASAPRGVTIVEHHHHHGPAYADPAADAVAYRQQPSVTYRDDPRAAVRPEVHHESAYYRPRPAAAVQVASSPPQQATPPVGWGLRSPPRRHDEMPPAAAALAVPVASPHDHYYHHYGRADERARYADSVWRDDAKYTSPLPPPRGLSGSRYDVLRSPQ